MLLNRAIDKLIDTSIKISRYTFVLLTIYDRKKKIIFILYFHSNHKMLCAFDLFMNILYYYVSFQTTKIECVVKFSISIGRILVFGI